MLNGLWSFIKKNKYEIAYRGWNGLTASAVAYQLYNNPAASMAEYVPDIVLHSIEAFIPDNLPAPMMIGLNLLRAGQAGTAFLTGQAKFPIAAPSNIPFGMLGVLPGISMISTATTIPAAANGVDVLNHAINIHRHLKELMPENGFDPKAKNARTFLPARQRQAEQPLQRAAHHARQQHTFARNRSKATI